jgi:hypothetical protein
MIKSELIEALTVLNTLLKSMELEQIIKVSIPNSNLYKLASLIASNQKKEQTLNKLV